MKKFLSWISACVLTLTSLFVLVACGKSSEKAEELLASLIVEDAGTDVTEDFGVPSQIVRGEKTYPLTWESDSEYLTVSESANENDLYIISVNRPEDEQKDVKLTVTLELSKKNKATKEFTFKVSPYDVYDFSSQFKFEKDKRNVSRTFDLPTSYTLAGTNKSCTISWESKNTEYITIAADGKSATALVSFVSVPVKLAATFTYKNETTTKTYTVYCLEQIDYVAVTTPEENVAYKWGFLQVTLDNTYYWCNGTLSGNYGGTVAELDKSVDVYLEKAANNTWKMYFNDGTKKTYIYPSVVGSTKKILTSENAADATELTWNTEYNTFTFDVDGSTYYMGTYNSYSTISISVISYAATSFVSQFYKVSELSNATPTYTTAEKLRAEADLYSYDEVMYASSSYELTTTPVKFSDVQISYTVKTDEKNVVTLEGNKITIANLTENTTFVLTVTFTLGEEKVTKDITVTATVLAASKISDVIVAENGVSFKIQGVVVAVEANGYILYDGTDAIYVYTKGSADAGFAWVVGDSLELIGTKGTYNGDQIVPAMAATKLSTALDIKVPETPEEYTADKITTFLNGEKYDVVYVTINGKLIVDGNYLNLEVAGLTGQGSIKAAGDLLTKAQALAGKNVVVKGYTYAISKKKIDNVSTPYYLNMVLTNIEEVVLNLSDAEKVAAEKEAFTLNDMYPGTYDLAATGTTHETVAITYAVKTDEKGIATITDGKLKLGAVTEETTVVLTVTFALNDATDTKEVTIKVKALELSTIAQVIAKENDNVVKTQGVVVAVEANGYILLDNTDAIYVYTKGSADAGFTWVVGDSLELIGTRGTYNGDQIVPLYAATKLTTALDVTVPTTTTVYTATEAQAYLAGTSYDILYVEMTGKLLVSGNYLNLEVTGLTGQGSVKAAGDLLTAAKALENKNVIVKGYTYAISKKSGTPYYLNMVLTNIEEYVVVLTDAEKVAAEKEAFTLNDMYPGTYDLAATGTTHETVAITYAVKTDEKGIATITDGKLKLGAVTEETTVVLTVTFTLNDATDTKEVTIKVKTLELSTIQQAIAADDGTDLKIQGVVVAVATDGYILLDNTDAIYVYTKGSADAGFTWVVGDSLELIGKKGTYGGDQIAPLYAATKLATALDVTVPTTPITCGATEAQAYLAGSDYDVIYVETTATLLVSGNYLNLSIEGLTNGQGSVKAAGDLFTAAKALANKKVIVKGYAYSISKKSNNPYYVNVIITSIEQYIAPAIERVQEVVATAKALISSATYDKATSITFDKLYDDITLTVTLPTDAKTVSYDATTLTLTITPTAEELTETINIKAEIGTDANNSDVVIKTKLAANPYETVIMAYTNTTTSTNMEETGNAEKVGLDATLFTVNAVKNGGNVLPGLNKAKEIRMYGATEGNGNTITVSIAKEGYTATITNIKINFSSGYSTGAQITANDSVVTGTDGVYAINASSFELKNVNDGTTQVRFTSIEINYTLVALEA